MQVVDAVVEPDVDGRVSVCLTNTTRWAEVAEAGQAVGRVCLVDEGLDEESVEEVVLPDGVERLQDMRAFQEGDSEVCEMRELVLNGVEPEDEVRRRKFLLELPRLSVVVDGVLWYVNSGRGSRARLVVPRVLRLKLLEEVHSGSLCGERYVRTACS